MDPAPGLAHRARTTSTKAATSWSVTFSRSLTSSTVKAARVADGRGVLGGHHALLGQHLDDRQLHPQPGASLFSSAQTAPISGRV